MPSSKLSCTAPSCAGGSICTATQKTVFGLKHLVFHLVSFNPYQYPSLHQNIAPKALLLSAGRREYRVCKKHKTNCFPSGSMMPYRGERISETQDTNLLTLELYTGCKFLKNSCEFSKNGHLINSSTTEHLNNWIIPNQKRTGSISIRISSFMAMSRLEFTHLRRSKCRLEAPSI